MTLGVVVDDSVVVPGVEEDETGFSMPPMAPPVEPSTGPVPDPAEEFPLVVAEVEEAVDETTSFPYSVDDAGSDVVATVVLALKPPPSGVVVD